LNSTQKPNAAKADVATSKPDALGKAEDVAAAAIKTARPGLPYPSFARSKHRDTYFGETVADPYRVMENVDDPAVRAWVAGQNQLAEPYLTGIPARATLKDRLTKLWTFERFGLPMRHGQRYFFQRNDGRQNQSVLYVADSLDATPRVLIDPNTFSKDATVSLASYDIAPQGELIAYAVSDGGTDWRTWRIRRVSDGQDLTDELHLTKFTSIAWLPDGKSFFYSRYPQRAGDTTGLVGDDRQQVAVYYHVVGQPQSADVQVYAVTDHKTRNPYANVSDDGRWLLVSISDGFDRNAIHVADLTGWQPGKPLSLQRTLDQWDGLYGFLGNDAGLLFFQTTSGASRGRIIAVDMSRPAAQDWQTLVPEAAETITAAS
jgi:prolyl oligopeptidase